MRAHIRHAGGRNHGQPRFGRVGRASKGGRAGERYVPLHDELARRVKEYWFRTMVYGVDNLFCIHVHRERFDVKMGTHL